MLCYGHHERRANPEEVRLGLIKVSTEREINGVHLEKKTHAKEIKNLYGRAYIISIRENGKAANKLPVFTPHFEA